MTLRHLAHGLVGLWVFLSGPRPRDQRGLSQSVETALLVAGAVTIGLGIVAAITAFVRSRLAGL